MKQHFLSFPVKLLDSESRSMYALYRSWVHNDVPHENQVGIFIFFQMNATIGCLFKLI
uniref:Uncharacterized protein n=1 Tax=Arundo donax TaxID=35708 RepID=A0A0A9HH85_ARUDO